jgi:tripartite-type tricarboxylate transporter receptor subunit TctC
MSRVSQNIQTRKDGMRMLAKIAICAGALGVFTSVCSANEDVAAFYKGKSIRLIIGGAAGGGYDAYGRLIARFMPKYIPGNPTIVPSNMPGGGGSIAAAHLYNVAPKDGTIIAAVLPGTITDQLLQARATAKFEPAKLVYLGSKGALRAISQPCRRISSAASSRS